MSRTTRNRRKKQNKNFAKLKKLAENTLHYFDWWGHSTIDMKQWEEEARSHSVIALPDNVNDIVRYFQNNWGGPGEPSIIEVDAAGNPVR